MEILIFEQLYYFPFQRFDRQMDLIKNQSILKINLI